MPSNDPPKVPCAPGNYHPKPTPRRRQVRPLGLACICSCVCHFSIDRIYCMYRRAVKPLPSMRSPCPPCPCGEIPLPSGKHTCTSRRLPLSLEQPPKSRTPSPCCNAKPSRGTHGLLPPPLPQLPLRAHCFSSAQMRLSTFVGVSCRMP